MYNVTVTLDYTITDEDMNTLVEMIGFGIAFWAENAEVGENDYTVYWNEVEGDPESLTRRTVGFGELAEALAYVAANNHGYIGDYARRYFFESDAGEIDSELADVVIQQALFGQTIYG